METPYYFYVTSEGSNQYAIRTKSNYNMIVNASGAKSADNTKLILWSYSSSQLPSNALFSLVASTDSHTHGYTAVETVPASPGSDGKLITKCAVCGRELKSESIGCPVSMLISKTEYTYSGKANAPAVTVMSSRGVAIDAKYYTVVYNNNIKAGKATAVVTFNGIYKGTMSTEFNINLKKSFAKAKNLKLKASAKKAVVKKLKSGKKYYVRIRCYMKSNSVIVYSSWSKLKNVKVK